MEVLPADGNNSNEALKEDKLVKVNGEMNGTSESMEVDEDSADCASDESVCGSSRVHDGDAEDPNSRFGSEADGKSQVESENEGKSNSHFESEGEGKNNYESDGEGKTRSQFGSEYAKSEGQMDVDGDGESINTEEEDHLLHSDNESREQSRHQVDADGDTEEEGDINEGADHEGKDSDEEDDISKGDESGKQTSAGETPTEERNGTAEQGTPPKKNKKIMDSNVTPRRSSRTVQKPVRFGQESHGSDEEGAESDDIEEIAATDPLADPVIDKENRRFPRMIGNTTIVVSDAKRLADIAAARSQASQPKKEPTLVIIDTNSILSGRGAVPMQTQGGVTITQHPASTKYPPQQQQAPPPRPKPPPILPTLTDDMYVVEAPSFIVPYVYEKPPVKKFKKYLKKMLKEVRKIEEERRKHEKSEDGNKVDKVEVKKEVKSETTVDEKGIKTEKSDEMEVDKESNKMDISESRDKEAKSDEDKNSSEEVKKSSEPLAKDAQIDGGIKQKSDQEKRKTKPDEESDSDEESSEEDETKKAVGTGSYFDNPLGKFFMQIGMNLVQEFVQTDLLKQQKKKQKMGKGTEETQAAIASLKKNLMLSKESNEPYTMEQTKCEFCSFKTESKLIMAHHLETPHMRNYVYRCNFCPLEVRGPHDILFHMEAEHCVRGRLERAPAFHQCPQCPFEDNQKGKLTRHLLTCAKKFRPEKNLEPPPDWEPPAKIPRLPRKTNSMPMGVNNPLYSQAMGKGMPPHLMPKMPAGVSGAPGPLMRPQRGRPPYPQMPAHQQHKMLGPRAPQLPQLTRASMMYNQRPPAAPVIMPQGYQISNSQLYQVGAQGMMPALQRLGTPLPPQQKNPTTAKLLNQPSISITPLPRQAPANPQPGIPPARPGAASSNSKTTFVICEICDGYIKDLEQLRNHMQWIHKVKIHPKMIYNRPPLNCQKCQFRFFTDQGLERHLLGSHGLVTSSMQDQANRGKDGGRCPVCGRVYQWKLLNHVARDHNMTLKPAHLSYKCTVCTATFGMYKQFESHVYSAHSVVAKRVMDKKNGQAPSTSRTDTANLLKPLKINDEITIIPQPAKKPSQQQRPVPGNYRVSWPKSQQPSTATPPKPRGSDSVQVIDLEDSPAKGGENGSESLTAVKERLKRRQSLEIRQLESEPEESESEGDASQDKSQAQEQDDDDQPTEGDSDG